MDPTIFSVKQKFEALRSYNRNIVEVVGWIALWLVASPLVMAAIKTLMSNPTLGFPYPWMLIAFSNLGTFFLCQLVLLVPGVMKDPESTTPVPWKYALTLGLCQGFEVGVGAEILHKISVTMRTEIHMLCPALMFVCGVAAGIERLEQRLAFSICLVTLGGCLASWGTMTMEGLSLVPIALVASGVSTLRWCLTQKWLTPDGQRAKPSPVELAARMSPATAVVGFLVAAIREPSAFPGLGFLPEPSKVILLISFISAGVCLMLVAEMRVVQLTSALLLGFLYPFHNVSVILFDASLRGTKILPVNWVGITLCAVASGLFSHARKADKDPLAKENLAASYQSTETTTALPESVC